MFRSDCDKRTFGRERWKDSGLIARITITPLRLTPRSGCDLAKEAICQPRRRSNYLEHLVVNSSTPAL